VFYVRTLCQEILLATLTILYESFGPGAVCLSLDFPSTNHNVTGRDKIGERKTLMFVLHDEFVTRLDYIFREENGICQLKWPRLSQIPYALAFAHRI
jgi:hypothetical protein